MSRSHDDNDIAARAAASTDAIFNDGKWFDWDDGDGAFSANAPTNETGVTGENVIAGNWVWFQAQNTEGE